MVNNGFFQFALAVPVIMLTAISVQPVAAHNTEHRGVTVFEESFAVSGRAEIDVEVGDADIILASHSGAEILVEVIAGSHRGGDDWAREVFERTAFTARKRGNSVVIRASEPHISRSEYQTIGGGWSRIKITHPASIDCTIDTGDGDVYLERIDGKIDLQTADGDISLRHVEGSEFSVHTADGDIAIESLSSNSASLHTADGDISIAELNGPLVVSTGDGDIDVRLANPGEVRMETGDGDVIIRAGTDLRADVEFQAEDVMVRGFELKGRLNNHRVQGQLNGGGNLLRVRTGDGSILLRGV
ncbi:MAG: DUF4097 family beta strand repeat-containing protein [Planctomycetota bacterium]|jgi:hypothetical protein